MGSFFSQWAISIAEYTGEPGSISEKGQCGGLITVRGYRKHSPSLLSLRLPLTLPRNNGTSKRDPISTSGPTQEASLSLYLPRGTMWLSLGKFHWPLRHQQGLWELQQHIFSCQEMYRVYYCS